MKTEATPANVGSMERLGVVARRGKMKEETLRVATFVALVLTATFSVLTAWVNWQTFWERQVMLGRVEPMEQRLLDLEARLSAIETAASQQGQGQQQRRLPR